MQMVSNRSHTNDLDQLQVAREQILQTILYAGAGLGFIVTVMLLVGGVRPLFWGWLVLYVGIVVVALFPRLGYQVRAWGVLLLIYGLGVLDFVRFSFTADGAISLFGAIALSAVLFGDRRTLLATAGCVMTLTVVSLLIVHGTLPFFSPQELISRQYDPGVWIVHILMLLAMTAAVSGGIIVLLRHLQASVRMAESASTALRETNQTLEQRVAERTAQLAAAVAEAEAARVAAEEANELKTKFLANMSHELRTPLNSIINFSHILNSGLRGPVTDGQRDYLNRVRASGDHLLGLINDILDLAKIEAGRMELFVEVVYLDDLVQSTMASAVGLTKDKSIELHHEIAEGLPTIEADKTRIRQVLLNLLSNAAKFTDEGHITVRVWQEGHDLVISVADTGSGIPADKLDTIFEEFRQADEGSDRSYQGTGLGLPICQRLVEMHGGRIWVESTVGVGSTFSFRLPRPQATFPESVAPAEAPADTTGRTVLVIDDDSATAEIISSYLQADGYTVCGISDSRQALEAARQQRPALIILDILMPHQDGWELLAAFKTDPLLHTIPLLLYTIVEQQRLGV